ncbi:MAG: M48 family metallopeptidase [Bacteroidota bacterium]
MAKHEIIYGQRRIPFTLKRKNVKNMNLNLKPNLLVEVSAHKDVPVDAVHKFVRRRASWIIKNMEYFKKTLAEIQNEKEYVNGESFKYLGKQYRLKVIKSNHEIVKCKKGFLNVYTSDTKRLEKKRTLVNKWFKERSDIVFNESLNRMHSLVKKYNISLPKITKRHMKARWGSCIKNKGIILLNTDLIDAPKFCIDYVILHELLHFKYSNHDRNFYNLLTTLMPDWEKRKEILDMEVVKNL